MSKRKVVDEKCEINEVQVEERYSKLCPYSDEQLKALERQAIADGQILSPMVIWQEENILIYGYPYWEIIRKHPEIEYTLWNRSFSDWQEAHVWAIEHHICQPSLTLWQKLELAIQCESYWEAKEAARHNKGARTDLMTPGVNRLEKVDTTQMLADKVGCGRTTVTQFKSVLADPGMSQRCRNGEISIKTAYTKLQERDEKKEANRNAENKAQQPVEMVTSKCNIFDNCEALCPEQRKYRIETSPIDPTPIAQDMQHAKVPQGCVWIAFYRQTGALAVLHKSTDERGTVRIKMDSFHCRLVSGNSDIAIFQAEHINDGTPEVMGKDESDFEQFSGVGA